MSKQAKRREAAKQRDALCFRTFGVRAQSIDSEQRTVETVISTETPVPMMDWERWEMVPEVLRTDGAVLGDQVPFLNSHNRYSMADQLGSARELRKEADQVIGRLSFASTAEAQDAFRLVQEGHATDVSAGYQVLEKTFVPRGTKAVIKGREYSGPVNVATKWRLREVSLTPIGADEQAKLRGLDLSEFPEEKGFTMNEQLRKLLESRGMPMGLDDDAAQRWAVENNFGASKEVPADAKPQALNEEFIRKAIDEATRKAVEAADQKRAELRSRADTLLGIAGLKRSAELSAKLDACRSFEEIEKTIIDAKAEAAERSFGTSPVVQSGPQSIEKFKAGMRTAMIERAINAVESPALALGQEAADRAANRDKAVNTVFPKAERSEHAKEFRNRSLYEMASDYVEQIGGVNVREHTRDDIAIMALFGPRRGAEILGIELRDANAYHTTGSFANLTLDAMNKSMMLGYTEAPSTWEQVMRVGTDARDFKQLHRLRLGSIPNLPVWPDNTDPKPISIADARESYAVESRSAEISFSYRLLVNDDMDALSRVPGQYGAAARRTVNKVAWSVITSNPTMSDSVALFAAATGARKRTNLTTGAGAPSTTTLQTLSNLMMQMRGENTPEGAESDDILSIMPRYIVGPGALYTTIMQLVKSQFDPADAYQKYNTAAILTPVIEPLLDAASTTAWYLFADPGQIDTVEVTFLAGQRTPVTRQELEVSTLSQKVYVLQTFGAKALNHRGMQKHAGA